MSEEKKPEKPKPEKSRKAKIAGIVSCVLWVAGFGLAFVIPPGSPFIWVPDTLLLLGFVPLLLLWRFSWPWIVFGLFNFGIGFVLLLLDCLPDSVFPAELHAGKHHLSQYHDWRTWQLCGLLSFVYGTGRMTKNIVLWSIAKSKQKSSGSN